MGASAVLSMPMIPVLALLASIQGALATTSTPFLLPVSQGFIKSKVTQGLFNITELPFWIQR